LEIASREFELEFKRLLTKSQPQIANVSVSHSTLKLDLF